MGATKQNNAISGPEDLPLRLRCKIIDFGMIFGRKTCDVDSDVSRGARALCFAAFDSAEAVEETFLLVRGDFGPKFSR